MVRPSGSRTSCPKAPGRLAGFAGDHRSGFADGLDDLSQPCHGETKPDLVRSLAIRQRVQFEERLADLPRIMDRPVAVLLFNQLNADSPVEGPQAGPAVASSEPAA